MKRHNAFGGAAGHAWWEIRSRDGVSLESDWPRAWPLVAGARVHCECGWSTRLLSSPAYQHGCHVDLVRLGVT